MRALALTVALTVCAGKVGAADDASLISEPIFDPSITVSETPQVAVSHAAAMTGLVITPIFDASITSDPNATTIMNTIKWAIAAHEARFTDPITVSITFKKMSTGLGRSATFFTNISYTSYLAALTAHATTADDATALAHLPGGANNPVNGNASMSVTTANLRALGFVADPPAGFPDSTIGLRTSICNLDRSSIDPSKYDLLAVASHEIDEALGFGSALNGSANNAPAPTGPVWGEDLFRYDQMGSRSLNTALASQAFFSIDGTTQLARFNQTAGGDFSDWFSTGPHTPQVQDAFATPGATPDLGVELTALDVIGYTFDETSVPPPAPPPAHDSVVAPPLPVTVSLSSGTLSVMKTIRVKVTNADKEIPGHTIQLTASDGNCPAGTVGTPTFDSKTPAQNSVLVGGWQSKTAAVPLTISSAHFATFNHKAPTRCALTFTASTVLVPGNVDPSPDNNTVTVELNVVDHNDAEQSTVHESVIASTSPLQLSITKGNTPTVRTVRATVGNADILPVPENPGGAITVTASDGDCPAGTVGTPDFGSGTNVTTVKGGKTAVAKVPVTVTSAKFLTASAKAPTRCTAVLTATGPSNPDPDPTNNTTKLVIDVTDKNDF